MTGAIFHLLYLQWHIFGEDYLATLYSAKLQVPLFTGFLTISGFLLSLTTFIIVKMYEGVYQTPFYYETRIETFKRIDPTYDASRPLKQLSRYLLTSVAATLAASFSQFTIGSFPNIYCVIACLSLATTASAFVLLSCWLVRNNIWAWIHIMEEKSKQPKPECPSSPCGMKEAIPVR